MMHLLHTHRHATPLPATTHRQITIHIVVIVTVIVNVVIGMMVVVVVVLVATRLGIILIRFGALWPSEIAAGVVERSAAVGRVGIRVGVDGAGAGEVEVGGGGPADTAAADETGGAACGATVAAVVVGVVGGGFEGLGWAVACWVRCQGWAVERDGAEAS